MAGKADIIADLPPLVWRGLVAPPYEVVTFEFANTLPAREVPYVDGDVHDSTGRRSFPMTARLFFLNTLGEEKVMFPDYWEEWRAQLDGDPGELRHPVLGPVTARVQNAKGEIRATTRSGVIVDIAWIETNLEPQTLNFLADLGSDPGTIADAADIAAAAFGVHYPTGLAQTSLATAWAALRPGLFAPTLPTSQALLQLLGIVSKMISAIEVLNNALAWAALELLITFFSSLKDQEQAVLHAARPTGKEVQLFDTTLDEFAARKGNTLNEVMGLNLAALRSPIVAKRTPLTFFL